MKRGAEDRRRCISVTFKIFCLILVYFHLWRSYSTFYLLCNPCEWRARLPAVPRIGIIFMLIYSPHELAPVTHCLYCEIAIFFSTYIHPLLSGTPPEFQVTQSKLWRRVNGSNFSVQKQQSAHSVPEFIWAQQPEQNNELVVYLSRSNSLKYDYEIKPHSQKEKNVHLGV